MTLPPHLIPTLHRLLAVLLCTLLLLPYTNTVQAETKKKATEPATKTTQDNEKQTDSQNEKSTPQEQAKSQMANSMVNIDVIQQTLEALRMEVESSKEDANINSSSVKTIRDGLELIDSKLKETYSGLDKSRSSISSNTQAIEKLQEDLLASSRDMRANTADLGSQKSLIEDNSIRLYEILIQISSISDKVDEFAKALESVQNADQKQDLRLAVGSDLNRLWIMLSIILTFFAPLAFVLSSNRNHYKPLADGTQQHQGVVLACLGVFLGYFTIGFSLMYGTSTSGWVGTSSYLLTPVNADPNMLPAIPFTEFVLYQIGFAILAAMIVYVTVGRQLSSTAHMLLALFVGAILIPVFGHWVWASHFIPTNKGWLEGVGFIDQAGSITINAVAAWFAFIIVWKLGHSVPPPEHANKEFDDPVYSSSGILLLWLSWLGFTTGTLPVSSIQIPAVMLNVGLAGVAGGTMAFLHYVLFHADQSRIARALGGFVSGLVAIAACAQSVTFAEAIVIGAVAGLLQNIGFSLLRKFFLRQSWQIRPSYLIAIHGVAGIWGAIAVALFGTEESFATPNFTQLVTQLQGIAAAIAYSIAMAYLALFLLAFRKKAQPAQE